MARQIQYFSVISKLATCFEAMRLGAVEKLTATLARRLTSSQLEEILVKCTDLEPWTRDRISRPIHLLEELKKKRGPSLGEFTSALEELLEGVSDGEELLETVRAFREQHSDEESRTGSNGLPPGASKAQEKAFSNALLRMGQKLSASDFEIVKAICLVPEGRKERATSGHALFSMMKEYGKIHPNNTELLHDIFTHLELVGPLQALEEYQRRCVGPPGPPCPPAGYPINPPPGSGLSSPPQRQPGGSPVQDTGPPLSLYSRTPRVGYNCVSQLNYVHQTGVDQQASPPDHQPALSQIPSFTASPGVPPGTAAAALCSPLQVTGGAAPPGQSNPFRGEVAFQSLSHSPYSHQQQSASQFDSHDQRPPPFNPAHFNKQVSYQSSAVPSHASHMSHQPLHNLQPPPAPPTTSPAPSAPPITNPAPSAPPITNPAPSVPPMSHSSSTHSFPSAMPCESLGNRAACVAPVNKPLPVTVASPTPGSTTSLAGDNLPPRHAGAKLIVNHSREICSHTQMQHAHRMPAVAHYPPPPQRTVFSQGEMRASAGGLGGIPCPSINASVLSEQENFENNRYAAPSPNSSGAGGGACSCHAPHNTLDSQYHAQNLGFEEPSLNSLSPFSSQSGGGRLATCHDPSTSSLVNRQRLREASNESSSFSAVSDEMSSRGRAEEVSQPETNQSSDSELTSENNSARKRTREMETTESSSSSSSDEEQSSLKRAKMSNESKSTFSRLVSRLLPFSWGKKKEDTEKPDSDSDEFEDAKDTS